MGQNSGDFFHKILERKKKVDIFVSTMLVFGFVLWFYRFSLAAVKKDTGP